MSDQRSYTAVLSRDPDVDAWNVQVAEEPGAISYGRTLVQARERIREALAALLDVEGSDLRIQERILLPDDPDGAIVASARQARANLERAKTETREGVAAALVALRAAGVSLRDAAQAVGMSHQRAQQILEARAISTG